MNRLLKKIKKRKLHDKTLALEDGRVNHPKLFVHIPKTAGTSFRNAAESRFGTTRVLRDYGQESSATSDSIKQEIYPSGDATKISQIIARENAMMLSGHFPLHKYGEIFGLTNTVTIFRNPVHQVISHFRHAVREHGFDGNFLAFASQDFIKNVQSRLIRNCDPALLGVVGLTESYKTVLKMVNFRWGWNLAHRKKNVSRNFGVRKFEPSDRERTEIERLNQADLSTYKRAQRVFENSVWCFERGFGCDPRGCITVASKKYGIKGWAFDMYSDDLVQIEILLNGKPFRRIDCTEFVPSIACWKLPRCGYVGFSIDDQELIEGDRVEIMDSETGLSLAIETVVD